MLSETNARLAILASGGGSNADRIISYFQHHANISVEAVFTNRSKAGVQHVAEKYGLPFYVIPKNNWNNAGLISPILEYHNISHLVLAGFLQLIPEWLIHAFPNRIVNIHPALLPKYGGPGMYGHHVHEAVKAAGDMQSGITIHLVDEHYDHGDIIFQHHTSLNPEDSAIDIAAKVLKDEHYYYPRVIEQWISGKVNSDPTH